MKILFFDTTQDWIHIALADLILERNPELNLLFEKIEICPKESSFRLVSEIQLSLKSLHWEKPDCLVCLTGPGSFTGLRITVSTARNLSQLWKIPVLGIDSLAAYSAFFSQESNLPILIAIDGKQNKYYFGERISNQFEGSFDLDQATIQDRIEKFGDRKFQSVYSGKKPNCFPDDSIKIEETLPRSMPILKENIEKILRLDYLESNFNQLIPNYIRGSYVETNKK